MSATENDDFTPQTNTTVSIAAHTTSQAFISILDDDVMELDETFAVEIIGVAVGGGISRMNVTIIDDDRKCFA